MKLTLDLHDIYNRNGDIDRALRDIIEEAVAKKAPLVEIIPGKGSGALNRDAPIEDPTMLAPLAEMLTERMVSAEWSAALIQRAVPHIIRTSG